MAKLQLAVVTAEGESFSGEVDAIVAPGEVGEFTVLPSHARLITRCLPEFSVWSKMAIQFPLH